MNKVRELHEQAMDLAEQAAIKKLRGDMLEVGKILRRALDLEAEAAMMVADNLQAEPTRSVLHRSAAALAIECGELQMAEKLIASALAGIPPLDIAEELKDLFIQINLRQYLERRGVQLAQEQLELLVC
ncbi:MAG: hypothetical protein F6K47_19235 [Symploca sp. SIO2E6]|nr:hypothetical protein [Symploca sp. SIO2E6]